MELRQLQYFRAVCETGSFTKAAEECYVSQSAVSQQIKALEAELGYAPIDLLAQATALPVERAASVPRTERPSSTVAAG